jgi:hypothetical protein
MFRARFVAVPAALIALSVAVLPARADKDVNFVDGVGYVDYSRPPAFKIGSWVEYHFSGNSSSGLGDLYDLKIVIAGEEKFWGEDCFWIESTTSRPGDEFTLASCISFAAFGDSLRDKPELFERKTIMGLDENEKPVQNIMRRSASSYRTREKKDEVIVTFDTLGTDTVMVPRGTFNCLKVRRKEAVYVQKDVGDSTFRGETYETRTLFYTDEVPVTSLVREDIETTLIRKAWKVGDSEHLVSAVADHAVGSMHIVAWGDDATAAFVPQAFRKPLKRAASSGRRGGG